MDSDKGKDKDKDKVREFRASHRFARVSPRKARYVIDLVRGLPVERALDDLRFSQKRATPMIAKVIRSALANATQEAGLETSNLFVAQALIDVGPRMKRFKARAMGRPRPRTRRFCHISVVLRELSPKDSSSKGKESKEKGKGTASSPLGPPEGTRSSPLGPPEGTRSSPLGPPEGTAASTPPKGTAKAPEQKKE
jgi:large subunit ribosomal protein L22